MNYFNEFKKRINTRNPSFSLMLLFPRAFSLRSILSYVKLSAQMLVACAICILTVWLLWVFAPTNMQVNTSFKNSQLISAQEVLHNRQLIADLQRLRMHNITRYKRGYDPIVQNTTEFQEGNETLLSISHQLYDPQLMQHETLGW